MFKIGKLIIFLIGGDHLARAINITHPAYKKDANATANISSNATKFVQKKNVTVAAKKTANISLPAYKKDTCTPQKNGLMEKYEPRGSMFPETKAAVDADRKKTDYEKEVKIEDFYRFDREMEEVSRNYAKLNSSKETLASCELTNFYIPTTDGHQMQVYMIRSKSAPKTGNVAVIDVMSGAALYGQNWFNQVPQCNDVHRLGNNVVTFSPAYRRPPFDMAPAAFEDVYHLIAHLYNKSDTYGLDKTKIGVYGASGGGYVMSGVGMILAQKDEAHMVKSFYMFTPMLDDTVWTTKKEELNAVELYMKDNLKSIFSFHAKGFKNQLNDTNLYPSKMSEQLIKKFPKTVMATTEFDIFRTETDKFAQRLKKAGRLEEYVTYPGSVHSFLGLDRVTSPIWQDVLKNYKKWVDCYLRN